MRILPDTTLDALRPDGSAMLVLPGNDLWPTPKYDPFLAKAREFLDAGVPVAAICGATGGLARAGLLDDRDHTSNALDSCRASRATRARRTIVDEHAVTDGDLITASATAPVEFAREILDRLGVYPPHVLASWYKLYGRPRPRRLLRADGRLSVREQQELLSGLALISFKLNGQFLDLAETLARPVGLTAAWWQVLGAVLPAPLSVAGIAREMGITRQSVQRIADLLVDRGLVEYRDNPAHRRAKLVAPTDAGRAAVRGIDPAPPGRCATGRGNGR